MPAAPAAQGRVSTRIMPSARQLTPAAQRSVPRAPAALRCGASACELPIRHRLETRTKESDMRASRRVLKPGRRKEADERVITAGRPRSSVKGSSWSMPVGTRKMVNYA
ncbi:hypothetical protein FCM35_KLT00777 [Carex littledalei]|uniref:Uncharacterized protein n=1 Tax=Carex littledalei TaxID=544730 RepID=A0A833S2G8_9POAL|nr:hypothetical protein FCM35_KLT00777 [Carex littledalei]